LTGRTIPGQDPALYRGAEYKPGVPLGSSGLHLILHDSAALGIELCIPAADDTIVGRVVPWLQDHLPMTLSKRQWRSWTPTTSGSFRARRIDIDARRRPEASMT
jgi:hypothetical protein